MGNATKAGVAAIALGSLGTGIAAANHTPIYGLTLVPSDDDMEHAVALLARDGGTANALVPVDLDSGAIGTDDSTSINGVNDDDLLVGIDYRPSDEMLYALGEDGTLYTVEMPSGSGGSVSADTVGSADYPDTDLIDGIGFDFNPVADAIRVVTTDSDSFVTSADDGSIVRQDPDTFYMDGDDNAGTAPQLSASGYTNSVADPSDTTLYDIDSNLDVLVQQDANPDSDTTSGLTTIGDLGIDANDVNGFDISGTTGAAYALIAVDSEMRLYRIDLEAGSAMPVDEDDMGDMGDVTDVDVLNYALTFEHLQAAFYHDFLDAHTESEVESSDVANYFARPTLQYSVYQQIQDVHDHKHAHVEKLSQTITNLGGTPVDAAEYEFSYDSIEEFVALADRLEAVGVSAYAGVAPLIDSTKVLKAALSIHSVTANHQTYFQLLHLQRPAPDAFNPARSMDQVLPILKQFIVGEGDEPELASATFDDQTSDGSSVTVASATLPEGGFVAIHDSSLLDGEVLGSVIGVSEAYDAGTQRDVMVDLYTGVPGQDFGGQSSLDGDQTLIAMPHFDTNGNGTYDFVCPVERKTAAGWGQ